MSPLGMSLTAELASLLTADVLVTGGDEPISSMRIVFNGFCVTYLTMMTAQ